MELNQVISLFLAAISAVIFWQAIIKAKTGNFFEDTLFLFPLGIYVWGDALILAPFWLISSTFFWFVPLVFILRFFLLFLVIRAAYETVYWINHQFAHKQYQAPLFRKVSWLGDHESAILYQVLNMCVIVGGLGLLGLSFWR